jgi:putative ABC transport system permease protein
MNFLSIYFNLIPVTLVQGLTYAFVAMGVMIPFRVINLPDLSSEGTFPLGGCVVAMLITAGLHPLLGTLSAAACGFAAGAITALIHLKFKVHSLLAGILTVTMLWSVNLRVMGKPNSPLFGLPNVYDWLHPAIAGSLLLQCLLFLGLHILLIGSLWWGLQTHAGLALRGVGANSQLAPALGIHAVRYTVIGFGLANAITATAGALVAQNQGYADVGMGFGLLVNGLASVIIGEAITGKRRLLSQLCAPVVGAISYFQLGSLALSLGLAPSDLKFATAVFVLVTLGWPVLTGKRPGAAMGA